MTRPVDWIREAGDDVLLDLYIVPRASRTRVVGEHDGRLRVQIAAPPVDGAANDAVVRWLADTLGVGRTHVRIVAGATSRAKRLAVQRVSRVLVLQRLRPPEPS